MVQERGIRPTPHRGFALPAAIFGLVIVGVLVTGGFYIARQETRIGIANRQATRAFYLAERGVNEVLENWNAGSWSGAAHWTARTYADTLDEGIWTVEATRMSDMAYFLDGTGEITRGGEMLSGATRRLGLVAKLSSAQIDPPAALTTRGTVSVRGGALVTGYDIVPDGWDHCPAATDHRTGILLDEAGDTTTSGGGEIHGVPAVAWDPNVNEETFTQFGDLSWEDLIGMADLTFGGGNFNGMAPSFTAEGFCDYGDTNNWGDPLNPGSACGSYFPMVYVNGNAQVQSAAVGQGILLVEGDLDLRGSFIYHGIIITQGTFMTQGAGHRIMGGVMAKNADLDLERLVGASIVQRSSCSVTQALLNNGNLTRMRPLAQRSWVDLSNLSN